MWCAEVQRLQGGHLNVQKTIVVLRQVMVAHSAEKSQQMNCTLQHLTAAVAVVGEPVAAAAVHVVVVVVDFV